jgi:hypothetical protein
LTIGSHLAVILDRSTRLLNVKCFGIFCRANAHVTVEQNKIG